MISYPVPLGAEYPRYHSGIFDLVLVHPIVILRVAGCEPGFLHPERPLPQLDGDDDALFVAAGVIDILDLVHRTSISLLREYSF